MDGKQLLATGRIWTESALDEALNRVAPGLPHRRLNENEGRELRRKVEVWLHDAPVGAECDATLRVDGSWDATAMSGMSEWLCNAGIIERQVDGHGAGDLANKSGIVISVAAKAPPSYQFAVPTDRFSREMAESGLARVYLVGGRFEPASDGARQGRWSEMIVHRRGAHPKPATDMIWVDPALHGGQSTLGHGLPESEVVLTISSDSLAHLRFRRESLGASCCLDDFAKWRLILRVALATSAAIGSLEASKWALSQIQDGSSKLFPTLREMFQSRAVTILRLAIEGSGAASEARPSPDAVENHDI